MKASDLDAQAMHALSADILALEQDMDRLGQLTRQTMWQQAEVLAWQLNHLTDVLVEKKLQLAHLRGDMRCPACQMINPKGHLFCTHCGGQMADNRKDIG